MSIKLHDLAKRLGATLIGDGDVNVSSCAPLVTANEDNLSFIYNKKYLGDLKQSKAGVVILPESFVEHCSTNALVVDNAYLSYAKAATLLHEEVVTAQIHASAVIDPSAKIEKGCSIAPNVVIGKNVEIGKGAIIGPNCVIGDHVKAGENLKLVSNVNVCRETEMGNNVTIHPGAVIGGDGFGYAPKPNKEGWQKIPQIGHVVIGNDVDIGSNTTIDCGALENTIIENGVKIDNQVQIAHNVQIGEHTAIAACTGIAGSTKIGKHCTLAGGVGLVGHITIADHVHLTGMTMVTHSITKPGAYSSGTAFQENKDWLKNAVRFKQLDRMSKQLSQLKKRIINDA